MTTVEIKSGYGLSLEHELKQLRAARRVAELAPVRVTTTLLALHAVPPEFDGRCADDFVTHACEEILPAAAEAGLADAVDVFCEHLAFSRNQCERVFAKAVELGLPIKGHMEQLSNLGGSEVAARFKALSVDHIEYLDEAGVDGDRGVGDRSQCCSRAPITSCVRSRRRLWRPCGEPACRWRWRPTSIPAPRPFASLAADGNMACILFGLTVEEALAGMTREAARALGLAGRRGVLAPGMDADLAGLVRRPPQCAGLRADGATAVAARTGRRDSFGETNA